MKCLQPRSYEILERNQSLSKMRASITRRKDNKFHTLDFSFVLCRQRSQSKRFVQTFGILPHFPKENDLLLILFIIFEKQFYTVDSELRCDHKKYSKSCFADTS
ncbi:CLUMA_CG009060, isoform A [Clunio marinus]|uniref:CLUMA_CG009060, isoform A n=1 Tax=Clunio marinus TaxID=568069 RepID=A0A1J1IAY6_9DIPT|nr:CLUMA_CG009060, isoform A [Clunio marinus]